MQVPKKLVVAGIAGVALAGSLGLALAESPALHSMTVRLPDGSAAEIRYAGNVPPKISFEADPVAADFFGADEPFAALDRIAAEMRSGADALMQQTSAIAVPLGRPDQLLNASLQSMPPGTVAYSMVSTMSGNGACLRSVEITSTGNGKSPQIVSRSSGNCGPASTTDGLKATAPAAAPSTGLQKASYRPAL